MNPANIALVPSYPAPDWRSLESALQKLTDIAPEFQVDIVDGLFVPARSWPFHEEASFAALKPFAEEFVIEMDCMVRNPQQYLDTFVELGVARVIIHYGSTGDYQSCLEHAQTHGYSIGLAVLPTVSFAEVQDLIAVFDYVQVMGIREVGTQGQPFAPEALTLISNIRTTFPDKVIAVDGAVNAESIPSLIKAGANRLAPGSAIIKADKPADAYRTLRKLIDSQQVES